jgi:hypothetical protein
MKFVWVISAMLFATSAAHAGAWEEFERRCLVPMEDVREPITEGFVENKYVPKSLCQSHVTCFGEPNGLLVMVLSQKPNRCSIASLSLHKDSNFENADIWASTQIEAGRYEQDTELQNQSGRSFSIISDRWREPRMKIFGNGTTLSIVVTAEETDLES